MPHLTEKTPTWAAFADTLVERLRRHHGLTPARFLDNEDEEPSELDILFKNLRAPFQQRNSQSAQIFHHGICPLDSF